MPLRREAANLSRMRSPITSRSNWAKDSRILSVSRPIEVVVLNDWVTLTKVTLLRSNTSTSLAKSIKRPAQAVDLVDHHDVDLVRLDIGQQALEGRTLQRGARDAAVIVAVGHQKPAFGLLAGHIGLAGLALGIEAVELLLQALLGRLAGVDRAAELPFDYERLLHDRPRVFFRPKKTRPFHWVPVICRAMAESDL